MQASKKITNIPKWPFADKMEEEAVKEVLSSGSWWRNTGTQVKLFEKEFAQYHGCKGGFTVANGTVALEIALKSLGIGEGDEVIVPEFTFYSTVSAVLAVRAIPVLVDVKEDTFCIDPEKIEKAVTNKTKAVIPVHMAGQIADMDAINEVAKKYNLFVIEDSAHAHGAMRKEKSAGSFGTMSTFSFQNAKLITAGEGGIILSNDEKLLEHVLLEANCGRAEGDTTYQHVLIGGNARLSEVQGAILRVQLSRLSEQIKLREKNYKYLAEGLKDIPGIVLQKTDEAMTVHPHYMVMFYYDKNTFGGASRAEFVEYLKNAGIPVNRSYECIHKLPVFKTLPVDAWRMDGACANSQRISDEVVCLNHNILLGDEALINDILEVIRNFNS
ncbi:DegT/DnrJ/EryC1/StrS family aminotransferase [Clostridium sp. BNL1100]|uniref:DegT/DnrJ/EryC1/StrS family aminotransferase n=1 Tax=Clostridium sp. BNL1100 TaxID=755731 RepID=UPI00024A7AD6|nr:DegT/DnrJ/EryC1/StrS family aminotransferase [Clostridium sp. BNL1100]AEY67454.1 putative PLP-dependent enzyme possibly involved in cell wall biogenesis [Clostridium sp. BNL1100]